MKTFLTVVFDDNEREVLIRALQEHGHLLEDKNRKGEAVYPIRSFLGRIRQEEPLNGRELLALSIAIDSCLVRLKPETSVETWQKLGAPGSAEAVAGLAATRQHQVRDLEAARELIQEARRLAFTYPPTKSEQREENAF